MQHFEWLCSPSKRAHLKRQGNIILIQFQGIMVNNFNAKPVKAKDEFYIEIAIYSKSLK